MTSTVFVNGVTLSDDAWHNDIDRLNYTIFSNPANAATARHTLLNGMETVTNSIAGDVAVNNINAYFDGPSIAQGTSGTWLASGTVSVNDTVGAATFYAILWDGTSVFASASAVVPAANQRVSISLSAVCATPAANLRISVRDVSATSGVILANDSTKGKDSTITAIRIA